MKFICEFEDLNHGNFQGFTIFFTAGTIKLRDFIFLQGVTEDRQSESFNSMTMKLVDAKNLSLVFTVNEFIINKIIKR